MRVDRYAFNVIFTTEVRENKLRSWVLEARVRQMESIDRLDRGAFFSDTRDAVHFGRVGRSAALFAYAGAGWGLMVLALFALADLV